jgi:hypothetical protein
MVQRLSDLQNGKLNRLERLKLADDLYKAGSQDEALALYDENLPEKVDKTTPKEAYLNYGTALLKKGDTQKAFSVYENLSSALGDDPKSQGLKDVMDKNVLSHFQQQEQKKKEQQQKKDQKENKDNKDQKENKDNQSGQGQQKDQQSGSGKQDKQDKKEGKNDQKNQDEKKSDKKDDQKKDDQKDNEDKKDNDENKKEEGENKEQDKPLPPKKLPAKLKQLMSDDRQLQMKMIENGTRDLNKRKSRQSKDW